MLQFALNKIKEELIHASAIRCVDKFTASLYEHHDTYKTVFIRILVYQTCAAWLFVDEFKCESIRIICKTNVLLLSEIFLKFSFWQKTRWLMRWFPN